MNQENKIASEGVATLASTDTFKFDLKIRNQNEEIGNKATAKGVAMLASIYTSKIDLKIQNYDEEIISKPATKGLKQVAIIDTSENLLKIRSYDEEICYSENEPQILLCELHEVFTLSHNFKLSNISTLHLENCVIDELPRNDIKLLKLKELILKNINLKEVPSFIYTSLETLELLDLSNNSIKSFDIEPACRSNIITLRISNNEMMNFPYWILNFRCPKLIEIDYSCNFLSNLNLKQKLVIKRLEMRNTQLHDKDLKIFKSIKTLEYLDISNTDNWKFRKNENDFKEINKLFIRATWEYLKVLKMNNLSIVVIPYDLFWFDSLIELYLVNCKLSWIPHEVQYLTNLKILDVSHNSLYSIPLELSSLPNLIIIKAQFNSISSVANFAHALEVLDLYENELEEFPDCIDQFKLIDLERNIVDMSLYKSYDVYSEKRNCLRQMLDYKRLEGPKIVLSEFFYKEHDESLDDEESDIGKISEFSTFNVENENWDDDEKPSDVCLVRNPLVTPSDDEWDGREKDFSQEKRYVYRPWFDVDEDWIFADAD